MNNNIITTASNHTFTYARFWGMGNFAAAKQG